jgi:hypothetical protein
MMINRRDLSLWEKEAYRAEADEEFMFESGFGIEKDAIMDLRFSLSFIGSWRIYETFQALQVEFSISK